MHLTPPIARRSSAASTAHAVSEQTSRRIGLGLRTRRHSATTTTTALVQRGTYNWHGQRFEIDEDTLPEWLEAATTRKRRAPSPAFADAQCEAMAATAPRLIIKLPISSVARPGPQLIVKLSIGSPAARAFQRSIANSTKTTSSISADSSMAMDIDVYTSPERHSSSSSELPIETGATLAPYTLLLDPPYVAEPDLAKSLWPEQSASSGTNVESKTEAMQAFYGSHMFLCAFHTTITKFLLQLDSRYLKCLQPGSVRLTTKLAHMGFVHRGLKDFNQRGPDGLRTDVAVIPVNLEDEERNVWVSLANVGDFDGVTGGSAAGEGKVATRKPTARNFLDSDDDELYT